MRHKRLTYQVITEELHDKGGVLVALLAQGVKLCRNVLVTETLLED
jgi:hypothetical protein